MVNVLWGLPAGAQRISKVVVTTLSVSPRPPVGKERVQNGKNRVLRKHTQNSRQPAPRWIPKVESGRNGILADSWVPGVGGVGGWGSGSGSYRRCELILGPGTPTGPPVEGGPRTNHAGLQNGDGTRRRSPHLDYIFYHFSRPRFQFDLFGIRPPGRLFPITIRAEISSWS